MNVYIPNVNLNSIIKRHLFVLTRPFLLEEGCWGNHPEIKSKWGIVDRVHYTADITEAQVVFLPIPINYLSSKQLSEYNSLCKENGIKGYGYIIGDYGEAYKNFEALTYFRVGGFKSQLPKNNIGLPVTLSDTFKKIYGTEKIIIREKKDIPLVGFCGHANFSFKQKLRATLSFTKKNLIRFIKNPLRNDYESLFASAYERAKLLRKLEVSPKIATNFIYRSHYRAGANTQEEMFTTMKEYYSNIVNSDYVLCVRGAGNFSVRLYETLMCGRIPVFIDTDCLLPFDNEIDWKKHVVWIPWSDRHNLAEIVANFHSKIHKNDFEKLQLNNRKLWKNFLSVPRMMYYIEQQMLSNNSVQ